MIYRAEPLHYIKCVVKQEDNLENFECFFIITDRNLKTVKENIAQEKNMAFLCCSADSGIVSYFRILYAVIHHFNI